MSGSSTVVTMLSGPPAATEASLISDTARCETFFAAGWGANTTALPAAIMLMALLMTVAAGLVEGVTEAITPQAAFSIRVRPRSPVSTIGDRHSTPGVWRAWEMFLAVLSSTRPMPVSATASSASSRACSSQTLRIASMTRVRTASVRMPFCARLASATASSSSANTPGAARRAAAGAAWVCVCMDASTVRTICSTSFRLISTVRSRFHPCRAAMPAARLRSCSGLPICGR